MSGKCFAPPTSFDFGESSYAFEVNTALEFDDNYRLAQLPLVNPSNPRLIRETADSDYYMGTYTTARCSLVLPVISDELEASPQFHALEAHLASLHFAGKINRKLAERRRDNLHATLVGGRDVKQIAVDVASVESSLASTRARAYRLMGPFLGRKNTGRLYFPVIPEASSDAHWFATLQAGLNSPPTRFFAVGYYHLTEELTVVETAELRSFLAQWCDEVVLETVAPELQFTETHDDLALSMQTVAKISA